MRAYAWERLRDSGEEQVLRGQHLGFYTRFAEDNRLVDTPAELRRLDIELDNFRAALGWAAPPEALELQLRLAGALWWLWRTHGHVSEGRRWLEHLLAAAAAMPVTSARAEALLQQCLDLSQEWGFKFGITYALNVLGLLARQQGDLDRAERLYAESLAGYRAAGVVPGLSAVLVNLAVVARERGQPAQALELLGESLALKQQADDRSGGLARLVEVLAGTLGDQGQADQAARLFGAAEALRQQIGAPVPPDERDVSHVRCSLDAAAFDQAWAEGRASPLERVVGQALALPAV
jgi:tetratricopeptide (TPR) repeat protein